MHRLMNEHMYVCMYVCMYVYALVLVLPSGWLVGLSSSSSSSSSFFSLSFFGATATRLLPLGE